MKTREEKETRGAQKGRKSRDVHQVFPMSCGGEGSKVRLAEVAGAETSLAKRKIENCTPFVAKAHVEVKMHIGGFAWQAVLHLSKSEQNA